MPNSTRKPAVPRRPVRPPRSKVLIEMLANGTIKVYADENVDVHSFNRLSVVDETPEQADLIDAYHYGTMPRCYTPLYYPGACRHVGCHKTVTVEQAAETLWKRSILRGLREMREGAKKR
jgi:hypothetical protein